MSTAVNKEESTVCELHRQYAHQLFNCFTTEIIKKVNSTTGVPGLQIV